MMNDPDLVLSVLGGGVALAFILAAFWVRFRDPEAAIKRMRQADREKHERQEYEANPGSFLDEEPTWEEPGFERGERFHRGGFVKPLDGVPEVLQQGYILPKTVAELPSAPGGPAVGVRQLLPDDDPHHDALWEAGGLAETAISFLDRGRWPEARALMAQIVETCEGGGGA